MNSNSTLLIDWNVSCTGSGLGHSWYGLLLLVGLRDHLLKQGSSSNGRHRRTTRTACRRISLLQCFLRLKFLAALPQILLLTDSMKDLAIRSAVHCGKTCRFFLWSAFADTGDGTRSWVSKSSSTTPGRSNS
jgi:hypothetical protein